MRPKLHRLHDRTEASYTLLDEAAAQYKKTQHALEELGEPDHERDTARSYPLMGDFDGPGDDAFDYEKCAAEAQRRENLQATLRDDKEEFDACVRSYGVSACKQIGLRMMETMPRELRDCIYRSILQDLYTELRSDNIEMEENAEAEAISPLRAAQSRKNAEAALNLQFWFLRRHYFQASYMGVEFVKELINTHLRERPFKVRAKHLLDQQQFFLADTFGLGCPLGQLLEQVEVLITSLHHNMVDMLQPLMAIRNTDCMIELTAPSALVTSRSFFGKCVIATSQELLDAMSLNLRRMRLKGYCVVVSYQGKVNFAANEREETKTNKRPRTTSQPSMGSTIKRQKMELSPNKPAKSSSVRGKSTLHAQVVDPVRYNTLVGRKLLRPRMSWELHHSEKDEADWDDPC